MIDSNGNSNEFTDCQCEDQFRDATEKIDDHVVDANKKVDDNAVKPAKESKFPGRIMMPPHVPGPYNAAPTSDSKNQGVSPSWRMYGEFTNNQLGKFTELAIKIGQLVDEKNQAYGDSFAKCGEFLKLLYPKGLCPEQYTDALCLVRIFDKAMRIATDKNALGESPYGDIAGYGLLGLMKDSQKNSDRVPDCSNKS